MRKILEEKQDEINILDNKIRQFKLIHPPEKEKQDQVENAINQLESKVESINSEITEIQKSSALLRRRFSGKPSAIAIVEDTMYFGTTINLGIHEFRVPQKSTRKTILEYKNEGIEERGYNQFQKPVLPPLPKQL